MQVLFKRSLDTKGVSDTAFLPIRYVLWVKFEVSPEERRLIAHHNIEQTYLTIEQSRRDFYRATIFAFFPALIITVLVGSQLRPFGAAMLFLGFFGIGMWLIYEQIGRP